MSRAITALRTWARDAEQTLQDRIDRWLLQVHHPLDMGDGTAVCHRCKVEWPCPDTIAILERRSTKP